MANTLFIDFTEINRLKLTLNEYLTLLKTNNIIEYNHTSKDIESLLDKGFLKEIGNSIVLSERSINYFQTNEIFSEFYLTFPHKVPGRYGDERPLRAASTDTNNALVTKGIFKKITRGNKTLQNHIIDVLKAEIKWRESTNGLQYMNNIDTWLRQHNWEQYEYLLNTSITNRNVL